MAGDARSRHPRRSPPAAEWIRVTSSASSVRQRRQQAGQSLGQHGLPRAGRADHEQVMATGRGNLDGAAAERLSAHVGQVGLPGGGRRRLLRRGGLRPLATPSQQRGPARPASRLRPRIRRGRASPRARHRAAPPCSTAPWRRPGRPCRGRGGASRSDPTRRRSARPSRHVGAELTVRHQDADGDRQVEAGAALPDPRWRQIDRHPPQRPRQAARQDRGAHPVTGLHGRRRRASRRW